MASYYRIAALPGDGIGVEVMESAREVLTALQSIIDRELRLEWCNAGAQYFADVGVALPEETLRSCESADAILFGAMGLPHVRHPDGTEIIPQLDLRMHFDLYAGVRPIRAFRGLPAPLASPNAHLIDLVLIRENTEGLFYARGRGEARGEDEVLDTMRITRRGTERVTEFAFQLAARRSQRLGRVGHVTNIDKANVFASMAFFRKVFEDVAAKHPAVQSNSAYVDAMALNLILKPWTYDVLVTENMFGDILSDLIAALVGGMGMAPSADIGEQHALFQPAHGTAPDIAGQGKANPTAMLLSSALMLDWLGDRSGDTALKDGATLVEQAVEDVFSKRHVLPMEFGGKHGTASITREVLDALRHRGS